MVSKAAEESKARIPTTCPEDLASIQSVWAQARAIVPDLPGRKPN